MLPLWANLRNLWTKFRFHDGSPHTPAFLIAQSELRCWLRLRLIRQNAFLVVQHPNRL